MYSNLVPLLQSGGIIDGSLNWAAGHSLFVVAGDSIDKGPDTVDVIDLWIRLSAQAAKSGGRLIHLLGNHEAEFLADPSNGKSAATFLKELASKSIPLTDFTDVANPRGHFLYSMPIAARVGSWLICHSGLIPDGALTDFDEKAGVLIANHRYGDELITGDDSILEGRAWWIFGSEGRRQVESRLDSNGIYGVIFGHQPSAMNVVGKSAISQDGRLIKIDNGMAPQSGGHAGSLLVFPYPADLNKGQRPRVFVFRSGANQLETIGDEDPSAVVPQEENEK